MLLYVGHVAGDCAEHIVPSIYLQLSEVILIDTNEQYYYYQNYSSTASTIMYYKY